MPLISPEANALKKQLAELLKNRLGAHVYVSTKVVAIGWGYVRLRLFLSDEDGEEVALIGTTTVRKDETVTADVKIPYIITIE